MNRVGAFGIPSVGYIRGNGSGAGGSATIPNQALAAQPAWFIDGSNSTGLASNSNDGTTPATPILTRGEFFRRMNDVTLTQNVVVTIMSSLSAGDTQVEWIFVPTGLSLTFVGTPSAAFTGVITAYTPRNGATNVVSQLTIAGLPVSWTASGLVGKIIEWTNGVGGFVRGTVVADLGAKTAWISPQVDQAGTPAPFVNGTTVTVWNLPSLGGEQMNTIAGQLVYQYLSATRWRENGYRSDYFNCIGGIVVFAGNVSTINTITDNLLINSGGANVTSGQVVPFAAANGSIRIVATPTIRACRAEGGGCIVWERATTFTPDAEFNNNSGTSKAISLVGGGRIIMDSGFVYGSSNLAAGDLIQYHDRAGLVIFANTPTVTGAPNIFFELLNKRELVSRLTLVPVMDYVYSNRTFGPGGDFIDAESMMRQFLGIPAETIPRMSANASLAVASGTFEATAIVLRAGQLVSNLTMACRTAAVAATLSRVGLYDKVGNLLASSVDQGASWQTVGLKTMAMSVPFLVLTTDLYYCGWIFTGVTGPGFLGSISPSATGLAVSGAIGAGLIPFFSTAGLADLPNPATVAVGTLPGVFWVAVT